MPAVKSASWSLQKAIYTTVDAAVGATPVYDYVPETATPPYVTVGIDESNDWGSKTWEGQEIIATVDSWSTRYGRLEAKAIIDAAQQALATDTELDLTGDGFDLILQRMLSSEVQLEEYLPGELAYHGSLKMRYLIQQQI